MQLQYLDTGYFFVQLSLLNPIHNSDCHPIIFFNTNSMQNCRSHLFTLAQYFI